MAGWHKNNHISIRKGLGIVAILTGMLFVAPAGAWPGKGGGGGGGGGGHGGGGGMSHAGGGGGMSHAAPSGGGFNPGMGSHSAPAPMARSGPSVSRPAPTVIRPSPSVSRPSGPAPSPSRSAPAIKGGPGPGMGSAGSMGSHAVNVPHGGSAPQPQMGKPRGGNAGPSQPVDRPAPRTGNPTGSNDRPNMNPNMGNQGNGPHTIKVKPRGGGDVSNGDIRKNPMTGTTRGNVGDKPNFGNNNNNSSGDQRFPVASVDKPRGTTRDAFGPNNTSKGPTTFGNSNNGTNVDRKPSVVRTPTARVDDLHSTQRQHVFGTNGNNTGLNSTNSKRWPNEPSVSVNHGGFGHDGHGDFNHNGSHHDDSFSHNGGWDNHHHDDFHHSHGCFNSFCGSPCWGNNFCFSVGFGWGWGWGWGWGGGWWGWPAPYYSPYWYPYDNGYYQQPTYVTNNNYYNYDGNGYTSGSGTASGYQDYSWMDDGKSDGDYRWLEESPTTQNAQKPGGLVEVWSSPTHDLSTVDEGWNQLANGDPHEARRVFMRAADASPKDGVAQVGFALASAKLERYDEAVIAMRRALREDPDSLNKIPNDPAVIESINLILDHYKSDLKTTPFDLDALFMTASMQYLLGQDAVAYFTVDNALERGDKDESATQLKHLIRESLDRADKAQKAGTPGTPGTPPSSTVPSTLNPMPAPMPSPIVPPATAPEKHDVPF